MRRSNQPPPTHVVSRAAHDRKTEDPMSYIHSLPHTQLGWFAGIPLYRIGTRISPVHGDDFAAGPDDLILGGGSGEHPAAVIPVFGAVASYIATLDLAVTCASLAEDDPAYSPDDVTFDPAYLRAPLGPAELEMLADVMRDMSTDLYGDGPLGDFSGWGGDVWAEFVPAAKRLPAPAVSYDPVRHSSVEAWIVDALGEYALISGLIHTVGPQLPAAELTSWLNLAHLSVEPFPMFRGVSIPAAGPVG